MIDTIAPDTAPTEIASPDGCSFERITTAQPHTRRPPARAQSSTRAVFAVLLAATFLNGLDASMFTGAAAVIARELHLGINDIGRLTSAFTIFLTVSIIPIGFLADRARRMRVIAACLAVWSLATALTGLTGGFLALFLTRMVTGIGEAGYAPAGTSLVGDAFPEERRSKVLSWLALGGTVGPILGLVFGGVIAGLAPGAWRFAFLATGLPGLALAVCAWRLRVPMRTRTAVEGAESAYGAWQPAAIVASLRVLLRQRGFACLLVMGVLTTFTATALQTYFPILLQQRDTFGMTSGQAASFASLALGPAAVVGILLGGYLADALYRRYRGARILVSVASVLVTAPLCVLSLLAMQTHKLPLFSVLIVVTFFINTLHFAPLTAAMLDVVPTARRGTAIALSVFVQRVLGATLAPFLIGTLARGFDPGGQHFAASLAGHDIILALVCTCPVAFVSAGIAGIIALRPARGARQIAVMEAAEKGVPGMSDFNPAAATSRKRSLALRLTIWAGVIGPILFAFVFSLDGFLKPDYSVMNQPISYLEVGSNGWIQRANFIVLGLLLILFALGFSQRMNPLIKQLPLLASTVLLLLVGLAFANDGVFIPAAPGESENAVHAVLHAIGFEVIFFSLPLACIIIGWQLRKPAAWRGYGWYSIITGLITVIPALFVLFSSFAPPGAQTSSSTGLINRIFVVEVLAWYGVMGIRLLTLLE